MPSIEFTVLLIEPEESKSDQLRDTLTYGAMRSNVYRVSSHPEALAFLHRDGSMAAAPRPDAIVMSSSLSRADVATFEKALSSEPGLRKIPVIKLLAAPAQKKHACHHRSQAA